MNEISSQKTDNNTNRLIVIEWITLAAVFVGCFFFLHNQITSINCSIEARMIAQEEIFNKRMIAQEQRTDRLYEMFIDLLKEKK